MTILGWSATSRPFCRSFASTFGQRRFNDLSRRAFHVTSRHHFIDFCLNETYTLITSLHAATGLSWAAALPLTALIVRISLIAPITLYSHSVSQRRLKNRPLLEAWAHVYRKKIKEEHAAKGPKACQKLFVKQFSQKSAEIYKMTGTQRWKSFLPYLQLPVWLTVIETIRRMCGTSGGLLGMIQESLDKSSPQNTPVDDSQSLSKSSQVETASEIDDWKMVQSNDSKLPEDIFEASVVPVEPTLSTEGALWFPDLLIPDPHLILPFILSATMFANIAYQERIARKGSLTPSAFQRRLGNSFKIVILAVGPLTLAVPSAIHIYWISSSAFALANSVLMNWYSPILQPRKPQKSDRDEGATQIVWENEARQIQSIIQRRQQNQKSVRSKIRDA